MLKLFGYIIFFVLGAIARGGHNALMEFYRRNLEHENYKLKQDVKRLTDKLEGRVNS